MYVLPRKVSSFGPPWPPRYLHEGQHALGPEKMVDRDGVIAIRLINERLSSDEPTHYRNLRREPWLKGTDLGSRGHGEARNSISNARISFIISGPSALLEGFHRLARREGALSQRWIGCCSFTSWFQIIGHQSGCPPPNLYTGGMVIQHDPRGLSKSGDV